MFVVAQEGGEDEEENWDEGDEDEDEDFEGEEEEEFRFDMDGLPEGAMVRHVRFYLLHT
jgi:hypothetical protein